MAHSHIIVYPKVNRNDHDKMTTTQLAEILGCETLSQRCDPRHQHDTRSLTAGTFLLHSRRQFDAHDFIAEAVKNGATAVLVDRPVDCFSTAAHRQ